MGDAGEGLIDADARIQERMEELERERSTRRTKRRETRNRRGHSNRCGSPAPNSKVNSRARPTNVAARRSPRRSKKSTAV